MKTAPRGLLWFAVISLALLTACGGGGSSSGPPSGGGGPQPQILTITTAAALPGAVQGHAYSTTLTATGGQGAYHWSIGNSTATGLSLDANTGVLSGAANFTGTGTFTATVTDSGSPVQTATRIFSIVAIAPMAVLPARTLDTTQYSSTLLLDIVINGGAAPFKVSVDPVCLPPGMKPNPANASTTSAFPIIVLGAPLAAGTYTCNITVQDSSSPTELATQLLTLRVALPNFQIASTLPSTLLLNRPVSARILGSGGTPPYSLSLDSGVPLPPGLSFDASTARISGTPTSLGQYSIAIRAFDSNSPAIFTENFFGVTVVQPIGRNDTPATASLIGNGIIEASISPYIDPPNGTPAAGDNDYYMVQSLGSAVVHVETHARRTGQPTPLDTVLEIVDGNGQQLSTCRQPGDTSTSFNSACINDDINSNILDSALDLQVPGPSNASTNVYIHVLDWRGDARPDMTYFLDVSGVATPLQITSPTSLSGRVGFGFVASFTATGGTGQYTWSVASGSLPPNMILDKGILVLLGVFSTTGTYTFDVAVADAGPPTQERTATVTITVGP